MKVVAGGFPKRLADSLQAQTETADPLHLLHEMVDVVDRSDSYTAGHSTRVAEVSAVIARLTDCTRDEIEIVKKGALLHDIGKIGIPEKVLRKHGPLTPDERHMINLHPIIGASILARVPEAAELIPIVLRHHEAWDGSGYPGRLSMTDIPKLARIVGIADCYDAMTSYRTYGPAFTSEDALQELRDLSGSRYEPRLVDAMTEAFSYGLIERRQSVIYPSTFSAALG